MTSARPDARIARLPLPTRLRQAATRWRATALLVALTIGALPAGCTDADSETHRDHRAVPDRSAGTTTDGAAGATQEPPQPATTDATPATTAALDADALPPPAPPEPAPETGTEETSEPAAALPDLTGWRQAQGHLGLHTLAWRPIDHEEVPRNVEFSADVVLLADGALVPEAVVQVTGYMPAHGHGLVQMPRCEQVGPGRFRVDGLLLHMRGEWQLRFSVVAARKAETVSFELSL